MNRFFIRGAAALLAALAPAISPAQTAPADAGARAAQPPPAWRSAFEGYQPFSEEKTASWPQANEAVLRAGGWRSYAREAAAPASVGVPAPTPNGDAADPHAGHHKP